MIQLVDSIYGHEAFDTGRMLGPLLRNCNACAACRVACARKETCALAVWRPKELMMLQIASTDVAVCTSRLLMR